MIPAVTDFFRLPRSIRKKIVLYYLHRISFTKTSDSQIIWTSFFYYTLKNSTQVTEFPAHYLVNLHYHGKPLIVQIRKGESSDVFVFFQVFIVDAYLPLFEHVQKLNVNPKQIIDAGANVGYFTLAISSIFNNLKIVAVEPDAENYKQLSQNLKLNNLSSIFIPFKAALWNRKQKLFLQKYDEQEWSYSVSESTTNYGECEAYSLADIIQMQGWTSLQILKIDIEGSESVLFQDKLFVDTLLQTTVVAVEIHDDKADRKQIHNIFNTMGFQFFEEGELTVAWKGQDKIV